MSAGSRMPEDALCITLRHIFGIQFIISNHGIQGATWQLLLHRMKNGLVFVGRCSRVVKVFQFFKAGDILRHVLEVKILFLSYVVKPLVKQARMTHILG